MKTPSLTALAAVLALSSPALAEKLTPERIFADPGLSGPTAKGVALSPDGTKLYTANGLTNDLTQVDVASLKPERSVPVGRLPWGVAIKP